MQILLGIVVGLLVLMFLIVAHEFGHFILARRSGVKVKEFGIGFPPRALAWVHTKPSKEDLKNNPKTKSKWKKLPRSEWSKDQDSLILSLNWLPIGGFCSMDGESDDDSRKGTFGSVSYWKKTKILFGGVAMNWLVAFIILTILAWVGLPAIVDNQFTIASDEHISISEPVSVYEVLENSPAAKAGFMINDTVESVSVSSDFSDANQILTSQDIIDFNSTHAGETVYYRINRTVANSCVCITSPCDCPTATKSYDLEVSLNPLDSEYLLGISMNYGSAISRYTWSAPIIGAGLTVQLTAETFKGLGNLVVSLVTGAVHSVSLDSSVRAEGHAEISSATEGVSGIVGIIGNYFPGVVSAGPTYVLLLSAIISISLACMNVLPIPALDGGRWFMITLARLRHKKLSKEIEQKIVARAFIFLLILMAIITIVDIIRLF